MKPCDISNHETTVLLGIDDLPPFHLHNPHHLIQELVAYFRRLLEAHQKKGVHRSSRT